MMEVANAGTPTDPLALEPLVGTDPPARVDPLLDELEASLVARPSQAAQMEPPSLLHLLQLSFADAAAPEVDAPSVESFYDDAPPAGPDHADNLLADPPGGPTCDPVHTPVEAESAPSSDGNVDDASTVVDRLQADVCLPIQTPLVARPWVRRSKTPAYCRCGIAAGLQPSQESLMPPCKLRKCFFRSWACTSTRMRCRLTS